MKRFISLALVLVLIQALAGCRADTTAPTRPETIPELSDESTQETTESKQQETVPEQIQSGLYAEQILSGESAGETGRDHIPPWVFKEMTRPTKQKAKSEELLPVINPFNIKGKTAEIGILLDKYIPSVEQMHTTLKKIQYGVHGHDCQK